MQVIKRDGRVVEFNLERIVKAVTLAMAQTPGGIDVDLANKIAASVQKQFEDKNQATVYDIQDCVEKKLMASSRKEVAQSYITYRYNRDVARKSKTKEVLFDYHGSVVATVSDGTTANTESASYQVVIKLRAIDLSYDNTKTGMECVDAQCALDKISQMIKEG